MKAVVSGSSFLLEFFAKQDTRGTTAEQPKQRALPTQTETLLKERKKSCHNTCLVFDCEIISWEYSAKTLQH